MRSVRSNRAGTTFIELPDGSISAAPTLFHFRRVLPGFIQTMGIPLPAADRSRRRMIPVQLPSRS